jgi:sugar phosphate isomerase/epimerase
MKNLIRLAAASILAATLSAAALCAANDNQEKTDTLASSVITGTRMSVLRDALPAPVSVVGRLAIGASDEAAVMPVLMEQVPGLFVTSRGVTGYGVGPIYMDAAKPDFVKEAFDYAAHIGVKTVVGVPFEMREVNGKKVRYESRALCEKLSALCDEYKMNYAIHNHGPDIPYLFPNAESAIAQIKDLSPRMGLCLDIGHQFRDGKDPVAAIRKFHKRLFDMHIKNVAFDEKKNIARPMPRGEINMLDVVRALCEVNYTGCCSLEYERFPMVGEGKNKKLDEAVFLREVAESVGYFRGVMDCVRG